MYRQNARPARPPTVLQYRTRVFRPWSLLAALLVLCIGVAMFGAMRATRIVCERSGDEAGSCRFRRYGLMSSLDLTLSPTEIASFTVSERRTSKGVRYAEVRLVTTTSTYGTVDLESGTWGHVTPERAQDVGARFRAFQEHRMSTVDEWLATAPVSAAMMTLMGLGMCALGGAMLREQLAQRRPIRVVVHHDREVVAVRKREIPFAEIDGVTVELGRAHFWSSRKNEHIPGHRLVIVTRFGDDVPVTREFRAGERGPHEGARRALLRALGRAPT
ncbi:MAG: hypothetical protein KF764_15740 [Labilithrix sp.]|nr:hypothetical protein [Labilithrix sp.]